ncbi:hypothetical protein O3P69_019700 [Scylla paramamosain]|uniref:Peptidase metallopeptidase domain-containing protein n=1 Tax=Scylla paramamosain TaxID=85552 RepID=A0AAW0SXK2_SCYPA
MRGDSNSPTNHTRKRRYLLQGKKWDKTELTWALRKSSRHTSRLDSGTIRQQFTTALQLWEKVSALKFTEVQKEAKNIDIYVDFMKGTHGDGYSFDGKGRKLAHAFYPGGGIGGDVHFDDDDHFVQHHLREDGKTSLLITAAHELGHSLGLSHSDAPKALMAPFYQDFGDEFELPQDDRYAIQTTPTPNDQHTTSQTTPTPNDHHTTSQTTPTPTYTKHPPS